MTPFSDVPLPSGARETATPAENLYPVALHIAGRRCIIVGGGRVGERKAAGLLECGAHVVIVAPELRSEGLRQWAEAGTLRHIDERFSPAHLEGAFLCVAATDNAAINEAVLYAAHAAGVLCNLAAPAISERNPDGAKAEDRQAVSGDFVTMGTLRRGDLLLAVTTGGAGPSLAARIKQDWEQFFGPEWEPYTRLLREMRERVQAEPGWDEARRTQALRRLVDSETIREKLRNGDTESARAEALTCMGLEAGTPCR